MKTTLRKTVRGIIATVDERPKENEYYLSIYTQKIWVAEKHSSEYLANHHKIIASTFGIGMEFIIPKQLQLDNPTEYEYTIQDNKVIIEV
jgi:hypothetical protein